LRKKIVLLKSMPTLYMAYSVFVCGSIDVKSTLCKFLKNLSLENNKKAHCQITLIVVLFQISFIWFFGV
jgi:hypothetical protein